MNLTTLITDLNRVFVAESIDFQLEVSKFDCGFVEVIPPSEIIRPTKREQRLITETTGITLPQPTRNKRDDVNSENTNNQTQYMISVGECFDFLDKGADSPFKYRYPFKLYAQNLQLLINYLPEDYYPEEYKNYLINEYVDSKNLYEAMIGVTPTTQNRVMLASKEMTEANEAGKFLYELRYAQFANDYLVVLKHAKEMAYTMLFIPSTIVTKHDLPFEEMTERLLGSISKTYVSIGNYIQQRGGKNLLVFGAPGTGKSHWVKSNYEEKTEAIRVTFHEEYSYQDFVGGLKPAHDGEKVVYRFQEGPFTRIVAYAYKNPKQSFTLIIEELNRANAAAVFGDLFQLLDRTQDGVSKYGIENKDIAKYLEQQTGLNFNGMVYLPSNLNIVATMNSADQGVFVLDTAFKRRWQFKYIPIEFADWHENTKLDYVKIDDRIYEISVKDFIETINEVLSGIESLEVNEDRLIGPYFIEEEKWDNWFEDEAYQKLLNYLWDDVARISRSEIFLEKYNQFSKICTDFKELNIVFNEPLHSLLMMKTNVKEMDT